MIESGLIGGIIAVIFRLICHDRVITALPQGQILLILCPACVQLSHAVGVSLLHGVQLVGAVAELLLALGEGLLQLCFSVVVLGPSGRQCVVPAGVIALEPGRTLVQLGLCLVQLNFGVCQPAFTAGQFGSGVLQLRFGVIQIGLRLRLLVVQLPLRVAELGLGI